MRADAVKRSRLGAIAAIVFLIVMATWLSRRYQLAPTALLYALMAFILVPMLVVLLKREPGVWFRVERSTSFSVLAIMIVMNAVNLLLIISRLVFHGESVDPIALMQNSALIWSVNALAFAILYWEIDAGGPEARAIDAVRYHDFDFPIMDDPQRAPAGWHPGFIDYLFIGFTTSTAFSPTEAQPLTSRAKLLMMVQSSVSLATIAVVAARTVNILK